MKKLKYILLVAGIAAGAMLTGCSMMSRSAAR